jgi:hypothetical protein
MLRLKNRTLWKEVLAGGRVSLRNSVDNKFKNDLRASICMLLVLVMLSSVHSLTYHSQKLFERFFGLLAKLVIFHVGQLPFALGAPCS